MQYGLGMSNMASLATLSIAKLVHNQSCGRQIIYFIGCSEDFKCDSRNLHSLLNLRTAFSHAAMPPNVKSSLPLHCNGVHVASIA